MSCVLIGLAYRNTRLGALHAITGPFCGYYEVAHGVANAILLPHVMRYNAPGNYEKFANIARALGVPDEGYSTRELALMAADAVSDLLEDTGLPADFKAMNLDRALLETVAKEAAKSANIAINPCNATEQDLLTICELTF